MLEKYLNDRNENQSLWLPELRRELVGSPEAVEVIFSLTSCSGERVDRRQYIPKWSTAEERSFAREVLNACVFNMLAVFGGQEMRFFPREQDAGVLELLSGLEKDFSTGGLSKCIRVSDRINAHFGNAGFRFVTDEYEHYLPCGEKADFRANLTEKLRKTAEREKGRNCCGVDIGGTDIKLAAAKGDRLICVKEYDWNPSESKTAEGIIKPVLLLVRLMRTCIAAEGTELFPELESTLRKEATDGEIEHAVSHVEAELGNGINVLDAVGVSYPDVVVCNKIIGGETPKTKGMRDNPELDYEEEFAKLTALDDRIKELCRADGRVRMANDGSLAAYTAAMELAHSPDSSGIDGGVIAHSLGTDLGTGWLDWDGTIPPIPLELYDCLVELGSMAKRLYPPRDLRSVCNENSGLPGVRRYLGQAGAFRMAWELDERLLDGFTKKDGDMLYIPDGVPDLRKPCLEKLMELAEAGDENACEVFYRIGVNLGQVCREAEFLMESGINTRYLFGRLAKRKSCFEQISRGCKVTAPEIELIAADSDMAFSPLMRTLSERRDATVAQFGQAIGSAYFAFS